MQSRNSIYYFRWPIPRALHPAQKPSTLKLSLCKREPKRALRLSRYLSHMGERWQAVKDVAQMDYKDVRKFLTDHFRQLFETQRAKMDNEGRLPQRKQLKTTKRYCWETY